MLFERKRRFLHHKVAQQPQMCPKFVKNRPSQNDPKTAVSGLPGDPIAVTLITNHSVFIK